MLALTLTTLVFLSVRIGAPCAASGLAGWRLRGLRLASLGEGKNAFHLPLYLQWCLRGHVLAALDSALGYGASMWPRARRLQGHFHCLFHPVTCMFYTIASQLFLHAPMQLRRDAAVVVVGVAAPLIATMPGCDELATSAILKQLAWLRAREFGLCVASGSQAFGTFAQNCPRQSCSLAWPQARRCFGSCVWEPR